MFDQLILSREHGPQFHVGFREETSGEAEREAAARPFTDRRMILVRLPVIEQFLFLDTYRLTIPGIHRHTHRIEELISTKQNKNNGMRVSTR